MNRTLKATAAIMLMMVFVVGCTKTDDSISGVSVSGDIELHDYVDLGLPSGTLWATCNVGAASPEDYGDHYAWGESYRKIDFYWENYKFGMKGEDKYCKSDSLLVLEPEDDVANRRWLYGWCMPTKEQWEELIQNTTSVVVSLNGVQGRLFTAANGNNLFLPAAGRNDADYPYATYWSSSVDGVNASWYSAWSVFFFGKTILQVVVKERFLGCSVRPVHPAV